MAQVTLDKSQAGFVFAPSTMKLPAACQFGSGLLCGEDIKAGDACYVKESDGLVYKSGGSGVTLVTQEGSRVDGFAMEDAYFNSGGGRQQAVTLMVNIDVGYSGGGVTPVPGRHYYLSVASANKGMLTSDAASLNTPPIAGLPPVAVGLPGNRLRLLGPS